MTHTYSLNKLIEKIEDDKNIYDMYRLKILNILKTKTECILENKIRNREKLSRYSTILLYITCILSLFAGILLSLTFLYDLMVLKLLALCLLVLSLTIYICDLSTFKKSIGENNDKIFFLNTLIREIDEAEDDNTFAYEKFMFIYQRYQEFSEESYCADDREESHRDFVSDRREEP